MMKQVKTFNSYVGEYLGSSLPHEPVQGLDFFSIGTEAQNFILRMLKLMKKAGCSAADFNPWIIWELAKVIPCILPGSLGGIIPPFTNPGRHKVFDEYIKKSVSVSKNSQGSFIDLGCGFPPVTTIETARNLSDWKEFGWKVFGIDRSFARFILIDPDGHYACFSQDHTLNYMQPNSGSPDIFGFYKNHEFYKKKFKAEFEKLHPMLEKKTGKEAVLIEPGLIKSVLIKSGGFTLIKNAIKKYETDQLVFFEGELDQFQDQVQINKVNVVRCMNLLVYFDTENRTSLMTQAGKLLDQEGIFIAGTNHASGACRRYIVYRKENRCLVPVEFAFSPDVLQPLSAIPWFTIQEKDPEAALLAELTGSIRSNKDFWQKFSCRTDLLLEKYGICRRGENGVLTFPRNQKPLIKQRESLSSLWQQMCKEGYVDRAADVLCKAGYAAFKNKAGDIAIRPSDGLYFQRVIID